MMVNGKPLALTEAAHDMAAPVKESHVQKLIEYQSKKKVGRIDLTYVAADPELLSQTVHKEQAAGNKIIVLDAVSRQDLANIAEVGFRMDKRPLFVGSAGLAEEVAKKFVSLIETRQTSQAPHSKAQKAHHVFIVSGSLSTVTRQQLDLIAQRNIPIVQADNSFLTGEETTAAKREKELSHDVAAALSEGHVVLTTPPTRLASKNATNSLTAFEITKRLGHVTSSVLSQSKIDPQNLTVIAVGGDTAISVFNSLRGEGIEIHGEISNGIVKGQLVGGLWDGLRFVTKAGGFGGPDTLKEVVGTLEA
jgi:uncharacterized protein YgbK (DUF1537 family)